MCHINPIFQVIDWNCEDVCEWLVEQGLAEYSHNFRSHVIDGRELLLVTDDILENKLGVGKLALNLLCFIVFIFIYPYLISYTL